MKTPERISHKWLLLVALGMLILTAVAETLIWAQASPALGADRKSTLVSGTIEALDTNLKTIKIKTDTGKGLEMKVANPDLLQELTAGDRVTVELDREGRAAKIMKTAPPELPPPPATKP